MAIACVCSERLQVTDTGELCVVPGSLGLRERVVFSQPGQHAFTRANWPWLARISVRLVGGGGGGGGALAAAGQSMWSRGGSGGVYAERLIDAAALNPTEMATVGAGGVGGFSTNSGTDGGQSSFGAHVVGDGGTAGAPTASGTTIVTNTGQAGPTNGIGDIVIPGDAHDVHATRLTGAQGLSGAGGGSPFGAGGRKRATGNDGFPGLGHGSGGGGAADRDNTPRTGGNGAPGLVVVDLYG